MAQECPNVTCLGGEVRGKISLSSAEGAKPVFTYARIPFGKPPLDSKRFMRPEPADPWKGVLDGSGHSSIPMQFVDGTKLFQYMSPSKTNTEGLEALVTEDCLHVTVYTTTTNKNANLPVMVWIYGGMLQMGFSDDYNGTTLAALHDVVVVVPNYRVGVFGFFSLDNETCPGNCGMFDQLLALEWVRDNIHCFGGDKNNVTIFGESAGATAVDQNVNSPLTTGLFNKAITESGQATNPKLYQEDYSVSREALFKALEDLMPDGSQDLKPVVKKGQTQADLLRKLQNVPAQTLLYADGKLSEQDKSFYCSLDGEFIVKSPWDLKPKDLKKISYLIGCNDSEYKGQLPYFSRVPNFFEGMTKEAAKGFLMHMPRIPAEDADKVVKACYKEYNEFPETVPQNYSQQCGEILTDYIFNIPAINAARDHVKAGNDVYFYYATFQPLFNHNSEYSPDVGQKPDWCNCDHGDDLAMVFGLPFNPGTMSGGVKFTPEEVELSRKFMKYFTNFAKTGNPNSEAQKDEEWPCQTNKREYLQMKTGSLATGKNLKSERADFWNEKVPRIIKSESCD